MAGKRSISITGAAHLLNEWEEILSEGWTTSPRRKVPANAGRLSPRRSRGTFRPGAARDQRFK